MLKPRGRRNIPTVLLSFGRHLVYAEGTKTEPLYVDDLKTLISEKLNVDKRDIEIVPVKTTKTKHTCELVDFAIKNVRERREKDENIDYVWIFYDKDSFDDFDEAYRKIKNLNTRNGECDSESTTWFACWSNECFEVWVYHYFENLSTPLPRHEYIDRINKFLKRNGCPTEYQKTIPNLHHFLTQYGGDINKAIKWMKAKDVDNYIKPNPSSGIYQFAEYISIYLDKENNR